MKESEKPKPKKERGIFERPKGSGVWWVRFHDQHGREHRQKVGPKGLAKEVYRKRKNEVAERRFFPDRFRQRDVMVATMIDEYLNRVKNKLKGYVNYEHQGDLWKEAFGGRTLREIVPGDVERYAARRLADGLAPATINRELAFLRRVFNVAIEDGKAEVNPVKSRLFFKENNTRVRFLSEEEEKRLREVIGELEWAKVAVALHTGLRQGEQFALRWENVDFTTGIITVPQSKSGEARRVRMNDTVREVLRALPSRLKSPCVFPSATDETPIDVHNYMNKIFRPAVKVAKIEGFRWHDLRHTFASRLVMAGVDLRTVQELMGHKTIEMTLRYAHLSPAHQLEAVQRLNTKTGKATGTTTGTEDVPAKQAANAGAEVIELPIENQRARRDSNPQPSDPKSESIGHTRFCSVILACIS